MENREATDAASLCPVLLEGQGRIGGHMATALTLSSILEIPESQGGQASDPKSNKHEVEMGSKLKKPSTQF